MQAAIGQDLSGNQRQKLCPPIPSALILSSKTYTNCKSKTPDKKNSTCCPELWNDVRAEVLYNRIDQVAIIPTGSTSYDYLPTFQKESNGACFVRRRGKLELAGIVPGFLKYEERPWRKRLLDTATFRSD
jgi:hypothetical protein